MKPLREFDLPRQSVKSEPSPIPQELLTAVWDAVAYLDSMSSFGPGWAKMEKAERSVYVIGYSGPMHDAGVSPVDVMPAARRYLTLYKEYPKAPVRMIEFARMCRDDRLRFENQDTLALPAHVEGGPVTEDLRRSVRARLGLE
jgi:hypothetical protein